MVVLVKYSSDKREMRRMLNLCPQCGKKLYGDEKNCIVCRAYHANKQSEYRNVNKDRINENNRNYYRRMRDERNEKGLCTMCGCERDSDYKMCSRCRAKQKEKARIQREKKSKRKEWLDRDLCFRCGSERKEGFKLCEKCYEDNVKATHSEKAIEGRKKANKNSNFNKYRRRYAG